MVNENTLLKDIQLVISPLGHRIFRNNTAQGWVGQSMRFSNKKTVQVFPGDVIIRQARPLHAGLCVGSSDGIGYTSDGKFLAIECKSHIGKPTIEQINFINQVKKVGGIAGVCRSVEDALRLF